MNDIRQQLLAFHRPGLIQKPEGGDGAHVCEVWEDGEITLTKGGSLFGQRGLHQILPPLPAALPVEVMPRLNRTATHGNVVCRYDDRATVRALIAAALGVDDDWKGKE